MFARKRDSKLDFQNADQCGFQWPFPCGFGRKGEQEDGGEKGEGNDRRDGEGEWDRGHGVF